MNTFILENAIWKVVLTNNEVIISDNEYINSKSDWLRLKEYCSNSNLKIKEMYISFRDHCIKIPESKWYYFRRMSLSGFGKSGRTDNTYQYFIIGSTDDPSIVHVKKYLIPELSIWEEEIRTLENNEESLI